MYILLILIMASLAALAIRYRGFSGFAPNFARDLSLDLSRVYLLTPSFLYKTFTVFGFDTERMHIRIAHNLFLFSRIKDISLSYDDISNARVKNGILTFDIVSSGASKISKIAASYVGLKVNLQPIDSRESAERSLLEEFSDHISVADDGSIPPKPRVAAILIIGAILAIITLLILSTV